jgi:triacylglycerol lipase
MNIVLLHGIFDSGRIFNRLVRALEAAGHVCHAPSMRPADGRYGIQDLACSIERYIAETLPDQAPFALIGFSMGGVVSRHYLQVLGGRERVPLFFSISCPHAGSLASYLCYGQGARDMRPGSPLLMNLAASESLLDGMQIHNYWTALDLVIIPASHCRWPRADSEMDARALLHRWMPSHPQVMADIVRRVAASSMDTIDCGTVPLRD